MNAPLTIIIPTLNAAQDLPDCFDALMEGVQAGLIRELIVSDGGSTDETLRMADAVGATILTGSASRGGQLRRGVGAARTGWFLIIHADTVLAPGWAREVAVHMRRGGAAHFRLAFRAQGLMPRLVAGWANLRSALFRLPYGDQGLLVPRTLYVAAGGYPDQPLMEDVALIRALGGPLTALPVTAQTGADRYVRAGWLRRGARNLWTLARYYAGTDPEVLARAYRR